MKIAICDDELLVGNVIERQIKEYEKETGREKFEILVFESGEQLIQYLAKGTLVDLVFLDIEFKSGMNGVEIGRAIRLQLDNQITQIVYVSGREGYDRQLFDNQPLGFIEKPVVKEKVIRNIELAEKIFNISSNVFCYTNKKGTNRIRVGEIIYFESNVRKINMITTAGRNEFYGQMKNVEEQLASYRFIRIHRSFLVNYDYVKKIEREKVVLMDDTTLAVGEKYYKDVRRSIMKYDGGSK